MTELVSAPTPAEASPAASASAASPQESPSSAPQTPVLTAQDTPTPADGDAAGSGDDDDEESSSEDDDDEDEVVVVLNPTAQLQSPRSTSWVRTTPAKGAPPSRDEAAKQTQQQQPQTQVSVPLSRPPVLAPNMLEAAGLDARQQATFPAIFELDIDALPDKPWTHDGADQSDWFNYGFDESTWREYCKRQVQMRLAKTMKKKLADQRQQHIHQAQQPRPGPSFTQMPVPQVPFNNPMGFAPTQGIPTFGGGMPTMPGMMPGMFPPMGGMPAMSGMMGMGGAIPTVKTEKSSSSSSSSRRDRDHGRDRKRSRSRDRHRRRSRSRSKDRSRRRR